MSRVKSEVVCSLWFVVKRVKSLELIPKKSAVSVLIRGIRIFPFAAFAVKSRHEETIKQEPGTRNQETRLKAVRSAKLEVESQEWKVAPKCREWRVCFL